MPRRLLLCQTHYSLDGYIAGPNNELLDWITTNFSQDLNDYITANITSRCDEILLGRKLAEGFIPAWKARPDSEPGAKWVKATPKTVFSSTIEDAGGKFGEMVRVVDVNGAGGLVKVVQEMKGKEGRDIVVYGGVETMQSLVEAELVDEFFLLVNPVAIGEGKRLFWKKVELEFVEVKDMECGIVVLHHKKTENSEVKKRMLTDVL